MSVLAGQATWQGTLFLYHSRSGVWTRMNRIGVSSRVGATDADRASPAGTIVAAGDANSAVRERMEALGLYAHCPIIRTSDQGHSSRISQTSGGHYPRWRTAPAGGIIARRSGVAGLKVEGRRSGIPATFAYRETFGLRPFRP